MYRLSNNLLPTHINALFTRTNERHTHNTRFSSNNYLVDNTNLKIRRSSVFYFGPKLWSSLPINFKEKPSFSSFKFHYKKHLVSVYGN